MEELYRQWGRNIALVRQALGLTQEEFGAQLTPPVRQGTVAKWEAGRAPRDHHKVAIANLAQQDVRFIFPLTRSAA